MTWNPVFIPLYPPDHPERAKTPKVKGYTDLGYRGVSYSPEKTLALRTDNLLVIDCDTMEAADAWASEPGTFTPLTQVTKRGKHFFYQGAPGERQGPVIPGQIDQKTTNTGYVVVYDPNVIQWLTENDTTALPAAPLEIIRRIRPEKKAYDAESVEEIGEGERSHRLTSIAGSLRRQGLSAEDIDVALQHVNETRCSPPMEPDEVTAIAKSVARYKPEPDKKPLDVAALAGGTPPPKRFTATTVDTIQMKRAHWLWKGRIPAGALTLLGGREGVGKSSIAFDVAAAITRGRLPGEHEGTPQAVLIVATEDSFPHTIIPRLVAAGADLSRVIRVEPVEHGSLTVPHDIDALVEIVAEHGAKLAILDPLMSRLGDLDTHKDAEVRKGLEPLSKFAEESGCSVLGLIHVNKTNTDDPLTSFMGSRAFAAVARSALFTVPDPQDKTKAKRFLAHVKCNLGPLAPTLGYTIGSKVVGEDDGEDIITSKVTWGAEDERSGYELLAANNAPQDKVSAADRAADWLDTYLTENGETPSADVTEAAALDGFSSRTLRRAAKDLGVLVTRGGVGGLGTVWRLPGTIAEIGSGT